MRPFLVLKYNQYFLNFLLTFISWTFGACFSSDKDGIDIKINDTEGLVPFTDEDGNPMEVELPIEGKLCEPKITTKWQGAQEDTLVDGKPALKADCCITCCYGGTIGFMDSGQEVY